ncbi:MAG TPA: fumarylacetoacetate hydrolase family protein [Geodermatophilus sp.]|nr:fumarylacetoacetate hydrolase family protein [Geodermatophilus sp.]
MSADPALLERIAGELAAAAATRTPVQPPATTYPGLSPEDAYAVAAVGIDRRRAAGARPVGHKIGLTSAAMQQMLGVDQPDYGALLDDMAVADGGSTSAARWCQPRIEPEVAFRLRTRLSGPGLGIEEVLAATEAVAPALEIIDSRVADWAISWWDTVADNASSAAFVVGPWTPVGDAGDLAALDVTLAVDGEVVQEGSTAAVLGHPATAVAWLAEALAGHGAALEPGAVVLSGSCTRAVDVRPGTRVTATVGGLGRAAVDFDREGA